MNILFVCTGNKSRSRAAEIFARADKPTNWEVESAGISTNSQGHKLPKKLDEMLDKKFGIDATLANRDHRSSRINSYDVQWADLIVYMQPSHKKYLSRNYAVPDYKMKCLASYATIPLKKIPDLAFISDKRKFRRVLRLIQLCVENLIKRHQPEIRL